MQKQLKKLIQIFKILLISSIFIMPLFADNVKSILILHSYSAEYPWTKGQHESFVRKLQQSSFKIDIHTEYLDTKYLDFDNKYKKFFADYLEKKYSKHKPNIIYVTDDNALSFLREYKSHLFPKINIIFSGINDMSIVTKVNNLGITGVFERKEPSHNLDIINKIAPDVTNIYFLGDDSNTYKNIERELIPLMKKHPKYTAYFIANKNIKYVIEELNSLSPSIIIFTTIGKFQNDLNKTIFLNKTLEQLTHLSKHIFMTMEDAYMHKGVIGGYVTSSYEQGKTAANMVLDFFKGKVFEEIDFILTSPNRYYFDRRELNNKNLVLPNIIEKKAYIINETISAWKKNIELIKIILLFLFLTIFCLLIFLVYLYRNKNHIIKLHSNEIKKQKEDAEDLAKEQKTLLSLFDKSDSVLFKWKNNDTWDVDYVSLNVSKLLGYELIELTSGEVSYSSCIHHDDISTVVQEVKNALEQNSDFFRHAPYRFITKNNKVKWILDYTVTQKNNEGEITHFIGYLTDITELKILEEKFNQDNLI